MALQLGTGGSGSSLETLDLFENHIGDDGAIALANALATHGCRYIPNLCWHYIYIYICMYFYI